MYSTCSQESHCLLNIRRQSAPQFCYCDPVGDLNLKIWASSRISCVIEFRQDNRTQHVLTMSDLAPVEHWAKFLSPSWLISILTTAVCKHNSQSVTGTNSLAKHVRTERHVLQCRNMQEPLCLNMLTTNHRPAVSSWTTAVLINQ